MHYILQILVAISLWPCLFGMTLRWPFSKPSSSSSSTASMNSTTSNSIDSSKNQQAPTADTTTQVLSKHYCPLLNKDGTRPLPRQVTVYDVLQTVHCQEPTHLQSEIIASVSWPIFDDRELNDDDKKLVSAINEVMVFTTEKGRKLTTEEAYFLSSRLKDNGYQQLTESLFTATGNNWRQSQYWVNDAMNKRGEVLSMENEIKMTKQLRGWLNDYRSRYDLDNHIKWWIAMDM